MRTEIKTFQGHIGIAAACVMPDGDEVILLANSADQLRKAFNRIVVPGSAPMDKGMCVKAIIIKDNYLLSNTKLTDAEQETKQ